MYLTNPSTARSILSGVQLTWIQSFPSVRLVDLPRLKNSVCPTDFHSLDEGENRGIHAFPKDINSKENTNSPHPGFELGSSIPFLPSLTVTLSTSTYVIVCTWVNSHVEFAEVFIILYDILNRFLLKFAPSSTRLYKRRIHSEEQRHYISEWLNKTSFRLISKLQT